MPTCRQGPAELDHLYREPVEANNRLRVFRASVNLLLLAEILIKGGTERSAERYLRQMSG